MIIKVYYSGEEYTKGKATELVPL